MAAPNVIALLGRDEAALDLIRIGHASSHQCHPDTCASLSAIEEALHEVQRLQAIPTTERDALVRPAPGAS
jgi:aspartate aminotransferase-like enzyme